MGSLWIFGPKPVKPVPTDPQHVDHLNWSAGFEPWGMRLIMSLNYDFVFKSWVFTGVLALTGASFGVVNWVPSNLVTFVQGTQRMEISPQKLSGLGERCSNLSTSPGVLHSKFRTRHWQLRSNKAMLFTLYTCASSCHHPCVWHTHKKLHVS